MIANGEKVSSDTALNPPLIEFLTENGFSIFRLSEIYKSIPQIGPVHEFLVRDPNGYEIQITVTINEAAWAEIERRCGGRIPNDSSYWISLAEHRLSDYLCENDDYPPAARLVVTELTIKDIDLARRWNCGEITGEA